MSITLNLEASDSATTNVQQQAPVKVSEAARLGKRVLEDEYGLEVALEGYKAPRQRQAKQFRTPGDGEQQVVERGSSQGSSLELISTIPNMGLLSLYAEDKMHSLLSQMSARMLSQKRQHSDDAHLERQINKFIARGGLASLRDEFPNECAILESFDKMKSLFV